MRLGISRWSLFALLLVVAGCEIETPDTEMDNDNSSDESDSSNDESEENESDEDQSPDSDADEQTDDNEDSDDPDESDVDETDENDVDETDVDETDVDETDETDVDETDEEDEDAGTDGPDEPTGNPDIYEPFTSLDAWHQEIRSQGGRVDIASHGAASDDSVAALLFPGNPDLGVYDHTSPGFATEIVYPERFSYGKFETRVRFGGCAEGAEEVVNGIFTYFNDGSDQDGDGLPDNSEIDIEQLCGTPEILWLTVYTDYRDFVAGGLKKRTRMVNMRTGSYLEFIDFPPAEGERGTIPGIAIPNFPANDTFYTVGFEWRQGSVRYYIVLDGEEKDLFLLDEPDTVPTRPAQFLINIWHAPDHWDGSGTGDYPASDSTMLVDSVKIWR